jgi:hypothetical protein
MSNASTAAQISGLVKLLRRGAYTNDPAEGNYSNHHYDEPISPRETLQSTYPATILNSGLNTYGTVRRTDASI